MPHVINGIGTWYVGKRNLTERKGTCRACNSSGLLRSYDTTLFFVVFFVPIIPLGSKRILHECSRCRRHHAMSLKEWERQKATEVADASLALDEHPEDPALALKAIDACCMYDAKTEFVGIAHSMTPALLKNAEVAGALGLGYRHFGMSNEAIAQLQTSLALKQDDSMTRALAVMLMRNGRGEEAAPLLGPIFAQGAVQDRMLLFMYVESMQTKGNHTAALAAMNTFAGRDATISNDKTFKKQMKVSTKYEGTGKTVGASLLRGEEVREKRGGVGFKAAWMIGPALGLIALGAYVSTAISRGSSHSVVVLNGTSRGYTVSIGAQSVVVPAHRKGETAIPEGTHTVHVQETPELIPDAVVTIKTNFFARPFDSDVYVINPDQLAIVDRIDSHYATRNPAPDDDVYFTGHVLEVYEDVDYPFKELPMQLQVSQGSTITKRGLELVPGLAERSPGSMAALLGRERLVEHVKLGLARDVGCAAYSMAAESVLEPQEIIALCRPMLEAQPTLVHPHRLYQDCQDMLEPEMNLEAEYTARAARAPQDRTLAYLAARATHDARVRTARMEAAAQEPGPEHMATRALAWSRLAQGDTEGALSWARKAVDLAPDDDQGQQLLRKALLEAGKLDELLALPAFHVTPDAEDWDVSTMKMGIFAARKQHASAISHIQLITQANPRVGSEMGADLTHMLAYCEGRVQDWTSRLTVNPSNTDRFEILISTGKVDEAAAMLAGDPPAMPSANLQVRLLLLIAAEHAGKSVLAQEQANWIVRHFETGGWRERRLAKVLSGNLAPDWLTDAESVLLLHPDGQVVFTAIGLRRADLRGKCFEMARALNHDLRFPHFLIQEVVK